MPYTVYDMAHTPITLSVLRHLDTAAVRTAARHESRMRQHALPPVSVYRWWARRTEAVSGAIVEAVSKDKPDPLLIADPFAGGGVIALAGLIRGHRLYVQDVNSWAAKSFVTMLGLPDPSVLGPATEKLHTRVAKVLESAYATSLADGTPGEISQTLRVAKTTCPNCASVIRLFPAALVSLTERVDAGGRDAGFLACRAGHLHLGPANRRSRCTTCRRLVDPDERYTSGRVTTCWACGWSGRLSELARPGGFEWDVVLVERACVSVRELDLPTEAELQQANESNWSPARLLPKIGDGVETRVLRTFGMQSWHDLYPSRQRVVVEELLRACMWLNRSEPHAARAIEAAVVGSAEMAGYASRWDPRYLKAYEAVANHRFNFTTLAVEPNVWGVGEWGRGTVSRRLRQFAKASVWLEEHIGHRPRVEGPVPAARRRTQLAHSYDARVAVGSSARLCVPDGSLDVVITDPPYHDDVRYAELSDIFRAWAGTATGTIVGDAVVSGCGPDSLAAYEERLLPIFCEIKRALKPGGHVILSYANRLPGAWAALFAALQMAGFRSVGYAVVHSENETDHAKAGRRACTLDVLIDVIADAGSRVRRYRPTSVAASDEEEFCHLVGAFSLQIGRLSGEWREDLYHQLTSAQFLSS